MAQRAQKTETAETRAIQVYGNDQFPALAQANVGELVQEVLGPGEYLDVFSLPRIKVPAGGGLAWELPDGSVSRELMGIIIHRQLVRAYWAQPFSGGGTPPDCQSPDAVTGFGNPGGSCARCPFAQWGSATGPSGEAKPGQACRLITRIFLLPPGGMLPIFLPLPPSSHKAARRYVTDLLARGTPYWHVVTRVGLQRVRSREGIEYSQATFQVAGELDAGTIQTVEAYRTSILPALRGMPVTEAEARWLDEEGGESANSAGEAA